MNDGSAHPGQFDDGTRRRKVLRSGARLLSDDQRAILEWIRRGGFDDLAAICANLMKSANTANA